MNALYQSTVHFFCRHALFVAVAALPLSAVAQQGFDQPPSGYPSTTPSQSAPAGYPPSQGGYPPSGGQMPATGMPPSGYQPPAGTPSTGYGPAGGGAAGGNPMAAIQTLLQQETQDFGVQPIQQLQTQLHGPTPTSIPGGQVITTDRLLALYQQGQQNGLLVFHVLGLGDTLPFAQNAAPASQPGTFDDQTQQEFGQYLQQVTQGNKARPMVFYCLNTQCWMSYNAALRAIHMGFTQVYWYRGGIEAWQQMQQLSATMPDGAPGMTGGGGAGGNSGGNGGGYDPYR